MGKKQPYIKSSNTNEPLCGPDTPPPQVWTGSLIDNLQSKIFFDAEIIIFSVFYLGMLNTIDRRMAGST